MNPFQLNFSERLQSWVDLRHNLINLPFDQQCVQVDEWWQRAPLISHYLHPDEMGEWPDPWELLNENTYCQVARALGICYTLKCLGHTDIELIQANDDVEDNILVRCGKYILNYHPNSVLNISLSDFSIIKKYNLDSILTKIR